jgi:hypothetical protein
MDELDPAEIPALVKRIPRAIGQGAITNYFFQKLPATRCMVVESEKTVVFFQEDMDFQRSYFYSVDADDLAKALDSIDFGSIPCVSDIIGRASKPDILGLLSRHRFKPYRLLKRLSCGRLPGKPVNSAVTKATEEDAEEVHAGLVRELDKYIGHFPSLDELRGLLSVGQVLVVREESRIAAMLLYRLEGNRGNLNQLFCDSGSPLTLMLLLNGYHGILSGRGIGSGYCWVDAENLRLQRLHRGYGYIEDGLWDQVCLRER